MEETKDTIKVAVRCKECSHLIAYKMSAASGIIEVKCRKCGKVSQINLALRKGKPFIFYRMAKPRGYANIS